jgi:hypothetical protein
MLYNDNIIGVTAQSARVIVFISIIYTIFATAIRHDNNNYDYRRARATSIRYAIRSGCYGAPFGGSFRTVWIGRWRYGRKNLNQDLKYRFYKIFIALKSSITYVYISMALRKRCFNIDFSFRLNTEWYRYFFFSFLESFKFIGSRLCPPPQPFRVVTGHCQLDDAILFHTLSGAFGRAVQREQTSSRGKTITGVIIPPRDFIVE